MSSGESGPNQAPQKQARNPLHGLTLEAIVTALQAPPAKTAMANAAIAKGKLAVALAFPASGHDLTSTPQKEDEAEWRKALTTALVSGVETIYFDNMYNPKGWDDTLLPIDSGTLKPKWGPLTGFDDARRLAILSQNPA